jgi:hypothetical protein
VRANDVPNPEENEMSLQDELFAIEEGFWLSGEDHFREHLDDECLLAFPQMEEMHGVFLLESVAASASMPNRWKDLKITDRTLLQATNEFAIISYRANVLRADGQPYSAIVSSGYADRKSGWKLAFHQHSPT